MEIDDFMRGVQAMGHVFDRLCNQTP
jgi:hypothetical protein